GQFITADVSLPAAPDEVAIPDAALIEEGLQSTVFVASDESGRQITRRKVAVVRRGDDMVFIRSEPTRAQQAAGCGPLRIGEWVVVSGAIELAGALDNELAS